MRIYALGQRGPDKRIGEDCILAGNGVLSEGSFHLETDEHTVLAVSDGVGGNPAGEIASFMILKGIREADVFSDCSAEYVENTIRRVNQKLVAESEQNPKYHRMAATLSGVILSKECATMFHIGNTRLYLLNQDQYMRQLTKDHTNVQRQVDMGMLTRREAEVHPDKSQIYACMGGGSESLADSLQVTDITDVIGADKTVFLSTDGLHDYVDIDDMEEIFGEEIPIPEKLKKLLIMARENGSTDDISMIYCERNTIERFGEEE